MLVDSIMDVDWYMLVDSIMDVDWFMVVYWFMVVDWFMDDQINNFNQDNFHLRKIYMDA